jgi:hypothetical protein
VLSLALAATLGLAAAGRAASASADEEKRRAKPQAPRETFGLSDPRGAEFVDKAFRLTPSETAGLSLDAVSQVVLAPLDVDALLRADEAKARQSYNKTLRFGVGRDLDVRPADGNWYDLADGSRLWALDVVASGALGVRLHFAGVQLPAGARLAIYAPGQTEDQAKGLSPLDRPMELYSAASANPRGAFWSGTVFGERARIEYYAPADQGIAGDELPFTLDRLQHIYLDPVQAMMGNKRAGACNNDVTCFPEWADVAKAVGAIGSISEGDFVFCTGQLINDLSGDFTPYWLTANHCLSTQAEARDSEIFWFYQTATCGGTPPDLSSVPRSLGTTLVSTNAESDYTLLMIDGALPNDVFWAGWTSRLIEDGEGATAIHHPSGDFKRISFGNKASHPVCGIALDDHVKIDWSNGPTEPGSSGSGIFLNDTQQLFGQLHCGLSSCTASAQDFNDAYGAFSTTFGRIASFMSGGSDDNSEPNDSCGKPRAVKSGNNLANRIVKWTDTDWYRIKVPKNKTLTVTLTFSNGNGDIDAKLYRACNQEPVAEASGEEDTEVLQYKNTGATANLTYQVFLFSDTRNNYTMKVAVH